MKQFFTIFLFIFSLQGSSQSSYRKDFDFFWSTLNEDYAYWDKRGTDWDRVKDNYVDRFDTVSTRENFVLLLEKVFNEIYDHHASLNTNTKLSQRLVPSGTDIWAEYIGGKPVIMEVRAGSGSASVGLRPGMEIVSFDNVPVEKAIDQYLPTFVKMGDKESMDFALRVLLAGLFIHDRQITVKDRGVVKTFYPDRPVALLGAQRYQSSIESKVIKEDIGYIRVNNSLGDNNLIPVFDSVLRSLKNTSSLILDLRETPGGGNTTVARAILGSFISQEGFYQKHELPAEQKAYGVKRSWVEIVSPRKETYTRPVMVLVNHWTGSVGEGIAIGFHALKRATIIGTTMARLKGANYSYQMPESKIGFSFPAEKLFHVNGTPRELFVPDILVDMTRQVKEEDVILKVAIEYISRLKLQQLLK
jgi:carboxyl-terminal processing protease